MKIDLHIHTKKTVEDNFKRDIEPEEFIKKMKEANIGIAGITNHNIFIEDQFKKIVQLNNNDILILPGVELTVFVNEIKNIKHMNLIFDNDNESILKLQDFLKDKNISSKNPIDVHEVIKFFNDKKVIFYPDKKSSNNERGFSDEEIKELFILNNNFKNVFVLDIKPKNYDHYREKGVNTLIGSDVKKWSDYLEESKALLNYYEPIKLFEQLYSVLEKNNSYNVFFKESFLKIIPKAKIENENIILKNIPIIEKSVNIIFGSKATGKTALLEALYNALEVDSNKKVIYKDKNSKKYNCEFLAKSAQDYSCCENEFKEIEEKICEGIKNIINYKEEFQNNYVNQFYQYYKNQKYNAGKFKIISVNIDIVTEPTIKNNSIKKIINDLRNSIKDTYSYNLCLYNSTKKKIEELIIEWKKEYCQVNLEFYKFNFLKNTIDNLTEILKNYKKIAPNINKFGLSDIFLKRLDFNEKINNLKNLIFTKNKDELKNEIILKEIIFNYEYVVPIENSNEKAIWLIKGIKKLIVSKRGKDKSTDLKDLLNSIIKRNKKDFSNPEMDNEKIKSIRESINSKNLNIFKDEFKFYLKNSENNNIQPSLGEKSYIFLKNELNNNDANWFFIDEPEEHLNNQFISEYLLKDLEELIKRGKTVIITTHNNILGINTKPRNYLMRENIKSDNVYRTWNGSLVSKEMKALFDNIENKKIYLIDVLLKYFEGNKDLYEYRGDIYNIKVEGEKDE